VSWAKKPVAAGEEEEADMVAGGWRGVAVRLGWKIGK